MSFRLVPKSDALCSSR